jgi:hypothetical protein
MLGDDRQMQVHGTEDMLELEIERWLRFVGPRSVDGDWSAARLKEVFFRNLPEDVDGYWPVSRTIDSYANSDHTKTKWWRDLL